MSNINDPHIATVTASLARLKQYCEREGFKGWDPFDGLNSRLYRSLPLLSRSAICRLVVIQGFKRCPVNLRRVALVPKQYNAKGIALLLHGYCNLHRLIAAGSPLAAQLGTLADCEKRIAELANLLVSLQSPGYSGACWGYNFDWQSRRQFLFPKGTPTVVATHFAATALMAAYEALGNRQWLDVALSSADFVTGDLHRTPLDGGGFLFSYSPLQGHNTVFNASLLGSRLLSLCYHYTGNKQHIELARRSVQACCQGQEPSGAWAYGMLPFQGWHDSFHTGYNLDALAAYRQFSGDEEFDAALDKGFAYYVGNFFEADGMPRYYDNKTWPIDIHCPAQLMVTLARLGRSQQHRELADKVMQWTIAHMQDRKQGYFYYQLKQGWSSKISYMRWSNAFMFYAMTYYLLGYDNAATI